MADNNNHNNTFNIFDITDGATFGLLFCLSTIVLFCDFLHGLSELRRANISGCDRIRGRNLPHGHPLLRAVAREWLDNFAIPFAERWGHGALNDDVRMAWHDAEGVLGLNPTVFNNTVRGGLVRVQRLSRDQGTAMAGNLNAGN